jgi:hypothetical protein
MQTLENMNQAVSLQTEQTFRSDFNFKRDLPENLVCARCNCA